jgi:hypothetical protein
VPVLESFDRGDKGVPAASNKDEQTFKDYQRTVGEDARMLQRATRSASTHW